MNTNVLAPSATMLTVSPNGEDNYCFESAAERATQQKARGLTKERHMVVRSKVLTAMCAEYRSTFAAIYGKSDRLPSAIFEKITKAADEQIIRLLHQVHIGNCTSVRRSFAHKSTQRKFVSRVQATGEDEISLEEQLLACHLAQGQINRRIEDNDKAGKLTDELRLELQKQLLKLNDTENFIKKEISYQNEQAKLANAAANKPDNK
jgi:hypothetical protein